MAPLLVILLSANIRLCKLAFTLAYNVVTTWIRPSSPIVLPDKSRILTPLQFYKAGRRSATPAVPISLRFKQRTSRHFLSCKALPIAAAPSGKIPFEFSQSSVMYLVFYKTPAIARAPSGPTLL